MTSIPLVVHRARPPTQAAPESSKPEKGKDKGKSAVPEPEPEPEVDPEGGGCLVLFNPLTTQMQNLLLSSKFTVSNVLKRNARVENQLQIIKHRWPVCPT